MDGDNRGQPVGGGMRGSSVHRRRGGRSERDDVRLKPVRVTVDLDPGDYEALRDWAHRQHLSHSHVMRTLLWLLRTDDGIAERVRTSGHNSRTADGVDPTTPLRNF
jgi:hypothetical protein